MKKKKRRNNFVVYFFVFLEIIVFKIMKDHYGNMFTLRRIAQDEMDLNTIIELSDLFKSASWLVLVVAVITLLLFREWKDGSSVHLDIKNGIKIYASDKKWIFYRIMDVLCLALIPITFLMAPNNLKITIAWVTIVVLICNLLLYWRKAISYSVNNSTEDNFKTKKLISLIGYFVVCFILTGVAIFCSCGVFGFLADKLLAGWMNEKREAFFGMSYGIGSLLTITVGSVLLVYKIIAKKRLHNYSTEMDKKEGRDLLLTLIAGVLVGPVVSLVLGTAVFYLGMFIAAVFGTLGLLIGVRIFFDFATLGNIINGNDKGPGELDFLDDEMMHK